MTNSGFTKIFNRISVYQFMLRNPFLNCQCLGHYLLNMSSGFWYLSYHREVHKTQEREGRGPNTVVVYSQFTRSFVLACCGRLVLLSVRTDQQETRQISILLSLLIAWAEITPRVHKLLKWTMILVGYINQLVRGSVHDVKRQISYEQGYIFGGLHCVEVI